MKPKNIPLYSLTAFIRIRIGMLFMKNIMQAQMLSKCIALLLFIIISGVVVLEWASTQGHESFNRLKGRDTNFNQPQGLESLRLSFMMHIWLLVFTSGLTDMEEVNRLFQFIPCGLFFRLRFVRKLSCTSVLHVHKLYRSRIYKSELDLWIWRSYMAKFTVFIARFPIIPSLKNQDDLWFVKRN